MTDFESAVNEHEPQEWCAL